MAASFDTLDFTEQLRLASGWAERQLLEDGIACPDTYKLFELAGFTYEPSRYPTAEELDEYTKWTLVVVTAYALGFALGQQLPLFGKVQR